MTACKHSPSVAPSIRTAQAGSINLSWNLRISLKACLDRGHIGTRVSLVFLS